MKEANDKAMVAMAMQFPKVKQAFKLVKEEFDKHKKDPDSDTVTLQELRPILDKLGAPPMTDEEAAQVFAKADLDGSKSIEFREFLICAGVACFLKQDNDASDAPNFQMIRKGFKVIETAFTSIDTDSTGSIDVAEFKAAMLSSVSGDTTLLEQRFAELDVNKDGDIQLEEFIYGFYEWVGMNEDDEEDEDD